MYICRINALEELLEQQKVSTDEKVAEESRKYSAALVRHISIILELFLSTSGLMQFKQWIMT